MATSETSATLYLRWNIPLSVFKNSILSMDLDQYFGGQSVFLNVTLEQSNRLAICNATAVNDMATGWL